jgi:hypothetical protein
MKALCEKEGLNWRTEESESEIKHVNKSIFAFIYNIIIYNIIYNIHIYSHYIDTDSTYIFNQIDNTTRFTLLLE